MRTNKKITNPFYNSTAWKKLRDSYRSKYPLCRMCEDRSVTRLAEYVDHKVPILIDDDLKLEWDNLQSLCAKCHAKKTQAVDVELSKGNKPKPISGSGSDGIPTDSNHPWNIE